MNNQQSFKKSFSSKNLSINEKKSSLTHIYKKILTFTSLLLIIFFLVWLFWEPPVTSPLSSSSTFEFLEKINLFKSNNKKIVYGFLPYWNLDTAVIQPELTHLSYFSLAINGNGNIITQSEEGTDPGYSKLDSEELADLNNQVIKNGGKVELVFICFNNDDIVSFTTNKSAHENFINSLDSILLAYPVNGINIDIEYTGEVTKKLRENFTDLMQNINQHLEKKFPDVAISIDVYASAASEYNIWDIEQIAKEVDYVIVMAYDFHRRSSIQAGPVAPLFGGEELWNNDINQYLKDFLNLMPKDKILLGIPFYGYGWQTTDKNPQAMTFPDTGFTASYEKVLEILSKKDELKVERHWDNTALAPYLTYTEDGEFYTIYYENPKSLTYKLEYVNQLDLPGIAIWALGYEGSGREMWEVVKNML